MKEAAILCLAIVSFQLANGNSHSTISEVDTCTPNFQEIFDFTIGDTYQYRETYPFPDANSKEIARTTSRYTINDKWINGNTITYAISGIRETVYYCFLTEPNCTTWFEAYAFDELLEYTDSPNHFLNSCNNQLISISDYTGSNLYSYLKTEQIESIPYKCIGGTNNIYEYNQFNELEHSYTVQLEMDYAAHLGLVKSKLIEFESTHEIILEGYVINGDTTGIIMDNAIEIPTSSSDNQLPKIDIYPNPGSGIFYFSGIDANHSTVQLRIINSVGQIVLKKSLTESKIDLSNFNKGVYFVIIETEEGIQSEKIILY